MEPHGVFKEVTKQRTNKDHYQQEVTNFKCDSAPAVLLLTDQVDAPQSMSVMPLLHTKHGPNSTMSLADQH
jgi:hypothetical protein